jgi:hypothetical protein
MTIFNLQGQLIKELNQAGQINAELLEALQPGGYILRVLYQQQEKVLKIIK